jgi:hypothetical protein
MDNVFLLGVYMVALLALLCVAGLIGDFFMIKSEKPKRNIVVGSILKPRV